MHEQLAIDLFAGRCDAIENDGVTRCAADATWHTVLRRGDRPLLQLDQCASHAERTVLRFAGSDVEVERWQLVRL